MEKRINTLSQQIPAFDTPLHVGRPNVGDRERLIGRIEGILDRHWLTNRGTLVEKLESRLQDYLGVRHCISMCNGTVALEIAIRALGLEGEVIVPSFTFIATAHALQWQEITPVFCDIAPATHNIDPERIEALITPRTTGIIGVHVWGKPCDTEPLQALSHRHGLRLMFDGAHAFGCSHKGTMIGNFGECEVFSFHATKVFNTFEGGAVATNNDDLAEKIRLMQNFGFSGLDKVIYIGTNGKMNEACAAMGLTNLESLDGFMETNRRNYHIYRKRLARIPGIRLLPYDTSEKSNWQYVVLEIDDTEYGTSRDDLMENLHTKGVRARRYFYPGCHRMEPYQSYYPHSHLLLPATERLCNRVLQLPTGTGVTHEDILAICTIIEEAQWPKKTCIQKKTVTVP
ncbi:MAG: aminotransferase class I/II-fold pyridoxal phosphate-dependent enzyme [Thermodesulfobacteriota bacterium]|nr:aminotransferase class I/II-fold pyridoxal phosphate-dependent enzyme [Thermodesulfobacteriota bacterium]